MPCPRDPAAPGAIPVPLPSSPDAPCAGPAPAAPAAGRLRVGFRHRSPGRGGDAAARLPAQRGARRDLSRDGARLRRGRGRRARRQGPGRVDGRAQAAGGGPRRPRDPRHPRPRPRAPAGRRHRRRDGVRAAAARGRARAARHPVAAAARGPAGRRHRPALRRRGPALDRLRGRRRSRRGPARHDRLPGRQGAARGAGGGGDRVLERGGRRAEGTATGHARVPRRRLRRAVVPRARPVRHPPHARRAASR